MGQRDHSELYRRRINSPEWDLLRLRLLFERGGRCERCGRRGEKSSPLQVHHKTYDRLGQEVDEDLELVCHVCHPKADAEREQEVEGERWRCRLDGWATKVYGEDWDERQDYEAVEERFENWLEDRDEL